MNKSDRTSRRVLLQRSAGLAAACLAMPFVKIGHAQEGAMERVTFRDPIGTTSLVGYLWQKPKSANAAAIVMLPGQEGPYGRGAGRADAGALEPRYKGWMQHFYDRDYTVLLLDSFSARGATGGYKKAAPKGLDPMTDRPRDAFGALAFLRGRRNVTMERVFLMGWAHGGTAALAALNTGMADDMEKFLGIKLAFRGAAVLYPGCNSILNLSGIGKYRPSGKIFMATAGKDDAADPQSCKLFMNRMPNKYIGANLHFPEATNDFDAGGSGGPSDAEAYQSVLDGVTRFFEKA